MSWARHSNTLDSPWQYTHGLDRASKALPLVSAVEGFQDRGEGLDAGAGDGIEPDDEVRDAGLGKAANLSRQLLWRAGERPGIHHPLPRLHRLPGGIEQIDLDADDAGERCRVATDVVAGVVDPGVEGLHRGEVVL